VMVSAIESASEIGSTKIGFHYIDRYVVVWFEVLTSSGIYHRVVYL
jgi:hypothetical protein